MTLDSIVDFIIYHMGGDKAQLSKDILRHREFDTITVVEDKKGIAGIARFNVHGETAHVLQTVIREDIKGLGILRLLVARSWHKFPYLRFITFNRKLKYQNKPMTAHRLSEFVKGK